MFPNTHLYFMEYIQNWAAANPIEVSAALLIVAYVFIATDRNYYIDDDPEKGPLVRWRAHANLLFSNWLNYFVYQETPKW